MAKILIVDDDPDFVTMVTSRLTANGYDVISEPHALWAARIAFEEKPDLILLDIKMPAGGGLSVFRRVRLLRNTAGIPVIFITANKDEKTKKMLLDMGAKDVLAKPFDSEVLLEKIRKVLL